MKYTKPATALLLAAIATLTLGQTTTAPSVKGKFTISKETTLVDGPLNADGTIDYLSAINKMFAGRVKNEDNAAIQILAVAPEGKWNASKILKTLGIPLPASNAPHIAEFQDAYLKSLGRNPSDEDRQNAAAIEHLVRENIWKSADQPEAAAWLKSNSLAMEAIENASQKPHWFAPWVSKNDSNTAWDALPDVSIMRDVAGIFTSRGMLRAGERDFTGALSDLRVAAKLARFSTEQHVASGRLGFIAAELFVLRGYVALAGCDWLTGDQLKIIRNDLAALPTYPDVDDVQERVETMVGLDVAMICIRGETQHIARQFAYQLDESKPIDTGDLEKANWDTLLREIVHLNQQVNEKSNQKFEDSLREIDAEITNPVVSGVPLTLSLAGTAQPHVEDVEAYLRMRPGETPEQFSKRLAYWWSKGDPGTRRMLLLMNHLFNKVPDMALVAVSLADYRLAHHEYPATLEIIGTPVLIDPMSGKSVRYRKEGTGYVLWSVGLNQVDDNGGPGDMAFHVGK